MKLSDQGAAFITRQEGFVSRAYRDSIGVWTIGTGFTNRSQAFTRAFGQISPGSTITRERNASLLRTIADAEYGAAVNRHIRPTTQHAYDGATSVCFNCGPGAATWKWARALAAGDSGKAADLLKKTAVTAGGKRLRGLVRRRREEAALIAHGDYGGESAAGRQSAVSAMDPQVRDYQKKLRALGYAPGAVDGVYGRKTRAAVIEFQRAHPDLVDDGILGRATITQIDRSMKKRGIAEKAAAGTAVIAGAALTAADEISAGWMLGCVVAGAAVLAVSLGHLIYRYRKDL